MLNAFNTVLEANGKWPETRQLSRNTCNSGPYALLIRKVSFPYECWKIKHMYWCLNCPKDRIKSCVMLFFRLSSYGKVFTSRSFKTLFFNIIVLGYVWLFHTKNRDLLSHPAQLLKISRDNCLLTLKINAQIDPVYKENETKPHKKKSMFQSSHAVAVGIYYCYIKASDWVWNPTFSKDSCLLCTCRIRCLPNIPTLVDSLPVSKRQTFVFSWYLLFRSDCPV